MKHPILPALIASAALSSAGAAPVVLPGGPIVLQYRSAEQYSPGNDINSALNAAAAGAAHGNWGIVQVDTIFLGQTRSPSGWQIDPLAPTLFSNGSGAQILGIFYGVQNNAAPSASSRGGTLDLYHWNSASQDVDAELTPAGLAKRFGASGDHYTGFTCVVDDANCSLLARFQFSAGADLASSLNTIHSAPGTTTFETYLSVDATVQGAWTAALDTDYFVLNPAQQTCGLGVSCLSPNDGRLDGQFTQTGASGWDIAGTDIFGLRKQGLLRAVALPAPGSLGLASSALVLLALAGGWQRASGRQRRAPGFKP